MGRALAIPNPRNGRRDGSRKILAERGRVDRRNCGNLDRDVYRIWLLMGSLSVNRARQTVRLENGAGIFPDHVRDDGALRRVRRVFFRSNYERSAAAASSDF